MWNNNFILNLCTSYEVRFYKNPAFGLLLMLQLHFDTKTALLKILKKLKKNFILIAS